MSEPTTDILIEIGERLKNATAAGTTSHELATVEGISYIIVAKDDLFMATKISDLSKVLDALSDPVSFEASITTKQDLVMCGTCGTGVGLEYVKQFKNAKCCTCNSMAETTPWSGRLTHITSGLIGTKKHACGKDVFLTQWAQHVTECVPCSQCFKNTLIEPCDCVAYLMDAVNSRAYHLMGSDDPNLFEEVRHHMEVLYSKCPVGAVYSKDIHRLALCVSNLYSIRVDMSSAHREDYNQWNEARQSECNGILINPPSPRETTPAQGPSPPRGHFLVRQSLTNARQEHGALYDVDDSIIGRFVARQHIRNARREHGALDDVDDSVIGRVLVFETDSEGENEINEPPPNRLRRSSSPEF